MLLKLASFSYMVRKTRGTTVHANKEQGRDKGNSIFILHGYADLIPAKTNTLRQEEDTNGYHTSRCEQSLSFLMDSHYGLSC